MRIGHHEPYDADKGSDRERRAIGAFAKRRDCAIAPRGAGDAKMDACEEDRGEDQEKHLCSPFHFTRHFQDARQLGNHTPLSHGEVIGDAWRYASPP